jgi:hypothetical protein
VTRHLTVGSSSVITCRIGDTYDARLDFTKFFLGSVDNACLIKYCSFNQRLVALLEVCEVAEEFIVFLANKGETFLVLLLQWQKIQVWYIKKLQMKI